MLIRALLVIQLSRTAMSMLGNKYGILGVRRCVAGNGANKTASTEASHSPEECAPGVSRLFHRRFVKTLCLCLLMDRIHMVSAFICFSFISVYTGQRSSQQTRRNSQRSHSRSPSPSSVQPYSGVGESEPVNCISVVSFSREFPLAVRRLAAIRSRSFRQLCI